jgi:hypothetical protein
VKTLRAASPNCTGAPSAKCLCDTYNNANAEACDENADCPDPAGPIGPICGGRRCLGGPNVGAACSANSACPAGICTRPGEPTKPNACLDDSFTGIYCLDPDSDGEGECAAGPMDDTCSLASGHAQRGCNTDAQCGGGVGSCESNNRKCFLTGGGSANVSTHFYFGTDSLVANGVEDPPVADPTLGSVFCVGPTAASALNNVTGLPGPARLTVTEHVVALP